MSIFAISFVNAIHEGEMHSLKFLVLVTKKQLYMLPNTFHFPRLDIHVTSMRTHWQSTYVRIWLRCSFFPLVTEEWNQLDGTITNITSLFIYLFIFDTSKAPEGVSHEKWLRSFHLT